MSTLSAAVQVCDRAILHTARARFAGSVCDRAILHIARARFAGSVCEGGNSAHRKCTVRRFGVRSGNSAHTARARFAGSVCDRAILHTASARLLGLILCCCKNNIFINSIVRHLMFSIFTFGIEQNAWLGGLYY